MANGDDDRRDLEEFLSSVHALLKEISERGRVGNGEILIPPNLQEDVRKAWEELERQQSFSRLTHRVTTAPRSELERVGMTGAQKKIKLRLFNWARNGFYRFLDKLRLGPLLEIINKIMDSLMPFGSEQAKELKDVIEWIVNHADEMAEPE